MLPISRLTVNSKKFAFNIGRKQKEKIFEKNKIYVKLKL